MAIIKSPGVGLSDATPADVTSAAGAPGTASEASRGDHRHSAAGLATADQIAPLLDNTEITTTAVTPGTLPANNGNGVSIDPQGTTVAIAHDVTPFFRAYAFGSGGFGSTATAVPTSATAGRGVSVHPDGDFIAVAYDSGDHLSVFPWDGSSLGTEVLPAASPIGSTSRDCAFSPDGTFVASAEGDGGPLIYPWNGTALGTPIAPTTTATNIQSVQFSSDGNQLIVGLTATPFVQVYPFDGVTLSPAVVPSSLPPSTVQDAAFSPDGSFAAVVFGSATGVMGQIYSFENGTFGSVITTIPRTILNANGEAVTWSKSGQFVIIGQGEGGGSVSLRIIPFDGTALGPETQVDVAGGNSTGNDVAITDDGRNLAVAIGGASPYLRVYELSRDLGI